MNNMNINSEMYDHLNGAQLRDAMELIERMKWDGIQKAPIIVDIGCGSGNSTSILSQLIPHDSIWSIDIDAGMVEFARLKNKNDSSIEFFLQDIGVPWDQLHPKLQELEGIVDLVWSNRALHWIPLANRAQASRNISRLLRSGGHFYANTTCMVDPTKFVDKPEDKKMMTVPTKTEQEKQWRNFLRQSNLATVSTSVIFVDKEWTYPDDEQFDAIFDAITSYYRRYLPDHLDVEDKDEILERKFRAAVIKASSKPIDGFRQSVLKYELKQRRRSTFYGQFQLQGTKV